MSYVQLLTAATATNSPPSGATAGVPLRGQVPGQASQFWDGHDDGVIKVKSTAGSGTMTVTLRIWAYCPILSAWFPLGTNATMANRGVLNLGNPIGEDGADNIAHTEPVTGLSAFTRVYLEITAIGGTATAISAIRQSRATIQ